MPEPLWCAIRLPQLPLEALRSNMQTPAVLAGRQRVLLACPLSLAAGITPGMKLATAHALCDGLRVCQRDLTAEQQHLRQLAWQLLQFTPGVALHQPCVAEQGPQPGADELATSPGLLLDLGGSLRLFRGSENLLVDLFTRLTDHPLSWQAGLGHTPLAAWVLSHAATDIGLHALHQSRLGSHAAGTGLARPGTRDVFPPALASLPLDNLPLHSTLKDKLLAPGFHSLAELMALPRPALGRRFGKPFLHWLERLLGERPDPREPVTPPARFRSQYDVEEPITHQQSLLPLMQRQLTELESYLHWRHQAVRSIRWQLTDHQGEAPPLIVRRTRAGSDAATWLMLTGRHLERHRLRAPVLRLVLTVSRPEQAEGTSHTLFHDPGERAGRHALLEKLASLPGLSLRQLRQCDDPLPELAQALTDPLRPATSTPPAQPPHARQPLWLFDPPQPLNTDSNGQPRWRGAPLRVLGPDRTVSSHWWQQPRRRDYFLARHPGNQALCWLYHCDAGWFLHGLF